ncbi:HNH endonuclease signature motif containing protein [Luteipulveratus mongoliensis]|uniref:HNH endonuclease signature motif containing protein n=1 Tax=Luteipulveratus mongoliensis TaxID=571913 RepID=UPI000699009A|nr:HNH endonuclease signature motif containing protein [Luteipulveratus mongoliensis]
MSDQPMPADAAPESLSLVGLPAHLASWLVDVVGAVSGRGPVSPSLAAAAEIDEYEAARAAAGVLITAAQGVQAWAESIEAEAIGQLVTGIEDDPGLNVGQHEARSTRRSRQGLARSAATVEVQLLTGLPITQCRERVAFATATAERAGYLRARLRQGTVSGWRARTLLKETAHLDPLTADMVAKRVLAPVGAVPLESDADPAAQRTELAGVLGSVPLSQATFRRRLARQLVLAESASEAAARATQDAVARRDVDTVAGSHGVAHTTITASRERAFAAQQRVTALARRARAAGDGRTLAQLRSDIATDLLIRGQVPGDALLADAPAAQLQVIVHLSTLLPGATGACSDADPMRRGGRRSARGRLISDCSPTNATPPHPSGSAPLTGHGVAEVPGYGFLTADQVRNLAFAEGSVWRRLVTDPLTGAVIDSASTYRPPAKMRRQVQARDQHCRAPGCEHPAADCDLDHDTPWVNGARLPSEGATHEDNLHLLHRAHHETKTRRWWHSQQAPDGSVRWSTLTGQSITTHLADHHNPAELTEPDLSRLEQELAALLEPHADPAPMTTEMAAIRSGLVRADTPAAPALDPPPF